jgi:hypothetical protein
VVAVTRSSISRRVAMLVGVISIVVVIAAVTTADSHGGQHH